MPYNNRTRFAAAAMAVTLGLASLPASANAATSAELQSELDQVSAQLETLYSSAEQASYDLDNVTRDLEDTNTKIGELEVQITEQGVQLSQKQSQLCEILSAQYKMGDETGLLSLILSSTDFSDLVSNIHYANKISEQKQSAIRDVREIQTALEENKSELETEKTEREQLVSDQQAKTESANAAVSEVQTYYNQLSDEVKEKLAEEQEAARKAAEEAAAAAKDEAEKKAAEEAAAAAAAGAEKSTSSQTSSADPGTSSASSSSGSESASSASSSSGSSSSSSSKNNNSSSGSSSSSSGSSSGSVSNMVSRALSVIGSGYTYSGYVWTGSTSSSVFTCSGLVDYALGNSTNTSWPESLYSSVSYITTDRSALNYGDLVFYSYGGRYPGHVGIYIGGGQIVDSIPNGGVQIRDLDYPGTFIGGGPIL